MDWLKRLVMITMAFFCFVSPEQCSFGDEPKALVVLGAAGEPEYGTIFKACGDRWKSAFVAGSIKLLDGTESVEKVESPENADESISGNEQNAGLEESHRQQILNWIKQQELQNDSTKQADSEKELFPNEVRWLILIGHGTTDRSGSKFNLLGPDLSAKELAVALKNSKCKWVIVNGSSSSGPFVGELSGANRIVITATKSGAEQNYSRFADYLSRALSAPGSDLDHDSQVSVLEAFLASSSSVARFYQDEGRLASEQALLDDNGDKRGTPALFFRGLNAIKAPSEGLKLDGEMAKRLIISKLNDAVSLTNENAAKAQEIESKIDLLRKQKGEINGDEFTARLEALLLELADVLLPM